MDEIKEIINTRIYHTPNPFLNKNINNIINLYNYMGEILNSLKKQEYKLYEDKINELSVMATAFFINSTSNSEKTNNDDELMIDDFRDSDSDSDSDQEKIIVNHITNKEESNFIDVGDEKITVNFVDNFVESQIKKIIKLEKKEDEDNKKVEDTIINEMIGKTLSTDKYNYKLKDTMEIFLKNSYYY